MDTREQERALLFESNKNRYQIYTPEQLRRVSDTKLVEILRDRFRANMDPALDAILTELSTRCDDGEGLVAAYFSGVRAGKRVKENQQ